MSKIELLVIFDQEGTQSLELAAGFDLFCLGTGPQRRQRNLAESG